MPIYTRTGDAGQTSLAGGTRVPKTHPRLEAYGTVDELASHIGLLAAHLRASEPERTPRLTAIQSVLFSIGANLARETPPPMPADIVPEMESAIDELARDLPPWRGFVLPGGTVAAAQAHVCRTVCRRAERRILALADEVPVDATLLVYINRLSDYLFVLAQHINLKAGVEETLWRSNLKKT